MKFLKMSLLLLSLSCLPSAASDSLRLRKYVDSLKVYENRLDSLYGSGFKSASLSAYSRYRLFAPSTYYYSIASDKLLFNKHSENIESQSVNDALLNIYLNAPQLVSGSEKRLRWAGEVREDITGPIRNKVDFVKKEEPVFDDVIDAPVAVVVKKPNFWTYSGDYYMQFLQNYVSGNWYKGGESNYSMVASAVLQANYNNKQKLKFDNKLEMKLGFQTSRSDTLHSLKTSEDLLRYTGKLGVQATKRWYYTLQLIAYTQFMRGYKSNDSFVYSDILSPFNANLSLGMYYNVEAFKKRLTGTVQLAPLAYNFRYVGRLALATRYGIDEGKHTLNDFGSEMTVDLTWKFSDNIKWKTRLYGYTTFDRSELEWENTITFQLSKFISSNLFIYPRFDDSSKRDDHHGYWQFKEYASFGFSYSF